MSDQKPRQFWLGLMRPGVHHASRDRVIRYVEGLPAPELDYAMARHEKFFRVIEYSAFEKMRAERDEWMRSHATIAKYETSDLGKANALSAKLFEALEEYLGQHPHLFVSEKIRATLAEYKKASP